MKTMLELRNVSKAFSDPDGKSRRVLSDISFALREGGRALVDGPSGAGKSTLLNVVSGLLTPDSGEVLVASEVISRLSEAARDRFRAANIAYVFQSFNLISPLNIIENLTVPLRLSGSSDPALEKRAVALLERFGLGGHGRKRPWQLSVGQRQRVAAARAILQRPLLLLADEPTASLDAASARAVVEALEELNREGSALLLATHDPALKAFAFDTVLTLAGEESVA